MYYQGAGFTLTTSGLNLPQQRCVSLCFSLLFSSSTLLSRSYSLILCVSSPSSSVFTTSLLDRKKLDSVHSPHSCPRPALLILYIFLLRELNRNRQNGGHQEENADAKGRQGKCLRSRRAGRDRQEDGRGQVQAGEMWTIPMYSQMDKNYILELFIICMSFRSTFCRLEVQATLVCILMIMQVINLRAKGIPLRLFKVFPY